MSAPDIARLVSDVIASTMERSQASFDKDAAAWAAQNKRLNEARSALAAAVAALGEQAVTPCPCPHAQRADELSAVLSEARKAMGCPEDDSVVRYVSVLRRAAEGEYGITQVDIEDAEARGRAAALAEIDAAVNALTDHDEFEQVTVMHVGPDYAPCGWTAEATPKTGGTLAVDAASPTAAILAAAADIVKGSTR